MPIILVLDANQRSALAVIRSLGRIRGTTVYAADSTTEAVGGASRYCSNYYQHPSLSDNPVNFLAWLGPFLQQNRVDMVFPTTEISSQLILMNPASLGETRLPYAAYDTVMTLANKVKLMAQAKNAGIPTPDGITYQNAKAVLPDPNRQYPVVIKPGLSRIWLGDAWLNTTVQIASSAEELSGFLEHTAWLQNHPFMLQEFIEGHGAGVFALYNQGEPVVFFAHKRLREKPPEGGVSVLSESVALDASLLEKAKTLLDAVKWHGVAMVEFRVAPDGTPYLMEVNTRFWGSLQLAIDAGVDFPGLLYQITVGTQPTVAPTYRQGQKLRWLLGDLDSLYLSLKNPKASKKEKLIRILTFLMPGNPFRVRHEVNRLNDLKPAYTELKQYVQLLFRTR